MKEQYHMKRRISFIIPQLFETNGRVEKFLDVAKDSKVQDEYNRLLTELKTHPKDFGKELRKVTWKGKTVDEVLQELADQ